MKKDSPVSGHFKAKQVYNGIMETGRDDTPNVSSGKEVTLKQLTILTTTANPGGIYGREFAKHVVQNVRQHERYRLSIENK